MWFRVRMLKDFPTRWMIIIPALCWLLGTGQARAQGGVNGAAAEGSRPAKPQIIVRFKDAPGAEDKARALRNSSRVSVLPVEAPLKPGQLRGAAAPSEGLAVLSLKAGIDPGAELARLAGNPAVAYAEPNYPIKILAITAEPVIPNDFEFPSMYALRNLGEGSGRTNADISAPEAWAVTTGSRSVVVAIVDTGIDYLHEDLRDNLWTNRLETPFNGLDDDGNGFVDDYHGYDFVSGDSDPFDDNQHGTHVAGTVGARGNNGIGTVGVCWEVSLMAVKAFDENGNGTVADAIAAIRYAVNNGARVINASWGLDEKSRALEEAAQGAADAGVLIVAAAGNNRTDAPTYPAAFESVLAVGATDEKDARADFSNYGPHLDIAAPGSGILSTFPENSYGTLSGTSMAAPHVAGTAALVLARRPNFTRQELFEILINSTDPVAVDQPLGNGRLNAELAVRTEEALPTARLAVPATVAGRALVMGTAGGSSFAGYLVRIGAGRAPTNWTEIATGAKEVVNGMLAEFDTSLLADGAAVVQLIVTNRVGNTAVARGPTQILNAQIVSPLSGDILAPGRYEIAGTVYGAGKTYELAYGSGLSPTEWTVIAAGESSLRTNGKLGEWDAANLPAGPYSLRLAVTNGAARSEFTAPAIFIEPKLKAGWPARLPVDADFPTAEWRNARPADLDGDGRAEIVVIDPSTRQREQRLMVYGLDGQLRWSRSLGFDVAPDVPVIGDIDGDGKLEIFADTSEGIAGFHADGTPLGPGWPVATRAGNQAKVLADLDGDGKMELIAYSQEYAATQVREDRVLAVFGAAGNLIREWELPWCGFTNDVQKIFPAVANIDDDPELEIVAAQGCAELAAYDFRKAEPKWRSPLAGAVISSPVIGDVDGDGEMDIVAAAAAQNGYEEGGLYAVNGRGQRWRGWPVLEEFSFTAAPALGDLDNDGRLEIVLPDAAALGAKLHVVQWDGFEADGWPVEAFAKTSPRAGVALADADGDGRAEVIYGTPGFTALAVTQRDPEYLGGIVARNFAGQIVPLNGANPMRAIPFEASGQARWHKSSPPAILDLDRDGRLDMVLATVQERTFGTLRKFKERSSLYAWDLGASAARALQWPMFAHDAQNSGAYNLPLTAPPPDTNVTRAIRDRVITGEDRELRIEPLANDLNAAAAPLRLVEFTQPREGSVARDGSVGREGASALLYLPKTNYSGLDEFAYVIADQAGARSTGRVIVRVKALNDPPVAQDIALEIKKNTAVDVFYTGKDAESANLSYRIVNPPKHGEIWNYPGVGNYYPARGFFGIDTFTYVASDGKQESFPAVVSITVINSNNPPRAIGANILTKTNRSVRITPMGTDPDGDLLTYEIVKKPVNGTVAPEENAFRFTPDRDYAGPESFTFRAFDGTAFGEEAKITVEIITTNAPPRASPGSATVPPNASSSVRLSGTDPDGDQVEYEILATPIHGELSGIPPELVYTPATNYLGPDRFAFKVSDGAAESAEAEFTLQVLRQNRVPLSKDQTISTARDIAAEITLDAADPDQDPLRVVILKGPAHGLLHGAGTKLTYAPKSGRMGVDGFTYRAWDGARFGNIARVTVLVSAPQDERPPSFTSVRRNGVVVELRLDAPSGKGFVIEASANLENWLPISGLIAPNGETFLFSDTNAAPELKFYRAVRPN